MNYVYIKKHITIIGFIWIYIHVIYYFCMAFRAPELLLILRRIKVSVKLGLCRIDIKLKLQIPC